MANLSNDIKTQILQQAAALAQTLVTKFVNQAVQDGSAFLQQTENDIATWLEDLKNGDITQKNFESLVRGESDLAKMEALKQAGLGQVAIDTFVNGFIQIVINVAVAAVHL
jgi:ribosomal protein L9